MTSCVRCDNYNGTRFGLLLIKLAGSQFFMVNDISVIRLDIRSKHLILMQILAVSAQQNNFYFWSIIDKDTYYQTGFVTKKN